MHKQKLWWFGVNINGGPHGNDFYEPRSFGRVFQNKGRINTNLWWKVIRQKLSWGGSVYAGTGGVFHRKNLDLSFWKNQVQQ